MAMNVYMMIDNRRDGHRFYFGGLAYGLVTGPVHVFQPQ